MERARSHDRTHDGSDAPNAHPVGQLGEREDIAHRSSAGGEDRRSDEAGQEPEDEQAGEVVGEDDGDLEDQEEEQTAPVYGVAAEVRGLLERRPDHCGEIGTSARYSAQARRRTAKPEDDDLLGPVPYPVTREVVLELMVAIRERTSLAPRMKSVRPRILTVEETPNLRATPLSAGV